MQIASSRKTESFPEDWAIRNSLWLTLNLPDVSCMAYRRERCTPTSLALLRTSKKIFASSHSSDMLQHVFTNFKHHI
jgi:hypothetical protein